MEFFRTVNVTTTEQQIQELLTLSKLEEYSTELIPLGDPEENTLAIGGLWGEFTLSRSKIKGGLRFALIDCPNALCWSITTGYPPAPEAIVIHLTINRQQLNQNFMEEIEEFLADHCSCLNHLFSKLPT